MTVDRPPRHARMLYSWVRRAASTSFLEVSQHSNSAFNQITHSTSISAANRSFSFRYSNQGFSEPGAHPPHRAGWAGWGGVGRSGERGRGHGWSISKRKSQTICAVFMVIALWIKSKLWLDQRPRHADCCQPVSSNFIPIGFPSRGVC